MSFYGHPYLSVTEIQGSTFSNLLHFDGRDNVQRAIEIEYQHLLEFIKTHPAFGIAKSPVEAENLIADSRIPIVLSIEGAYGTLETEDDFKKWIDERGVSIVTPFHLSEDHFGGVALMPNYLAIIDTPIEFFRALLITGGKCITDFCRNTMGLKNDGRELIDRLIKRHVWIDLAHANDLTVSELLPILKDHKLPVLVTHTSPREVYPAERGISIEVRNAVIEQDGMVGLIPTQDMLKKSWTGAECFSGLAEFRETAKQMIQTLGPERVTLASDINAPISGLSPLCKVAPGQMLSELEERGFYTYAQWNALAQYVAPDPNWHDRALKHFIELWKRVRNAP